MVLFGTILIRVLVGMFLLGMVGSAVVVLISFVEDFRELLSHD
jgi:RsiW-degrading membrane proteinase PrsW (M82 family)